MSHLLEDSALPISIVVPIMGPTGVGKSTFIKHFLEEERMPVGHGLTCCTNDVVPSPIDLSNKQYTIPFLRSFRVVVVDTPGFDDTYEGDVNTLKKIADWLESSYRQKMVLGGVIYLHDISSDRFSGTARRNLETFNHICGEAALSKVILGTTKWGRVRDGLKREEELTTFQWKSMIDKGSQTCQFRNTPESAWNFIDIIIRRAASDNILEIQKELVVDKKIIPETKAGKELRRTLQQALECHKQMIDIGLSALKGRDHDNLKVQMEQARENMQKISRQIQELKIPPPRRIRALLGL